MHGLARAATRIVDALAIASFTGMFACVLAQVVLRYGFDRPLVWSDELAKQERALVDQFKAAGMTVITPDVNAFRLPVLAKVPKQFEAKWGAGMFEKIQAVK